MSDLSEFHALLDAHKLAERDLEVLRTFIASGGEYRLTVNVEHHNDDMRDTVSRIIGSIVNMKSFLDVIERRQVIEVRQAYKAFLDEALARSISDGMEGRKDG